MPDIRINDINCAVQILKRGNISSDELKSILVNKVQGIGGRYTDLIKFLDLVGVVKQIDGFVRLIDPSFTESIDGYITKKMLSCSKFARDFTEYCKLVDMAELDRETITISASHTSISFIWFLLTLEQLGVLERQFTSVFVVSSKYFEQFLEFI